MADVRTSPDRLGGLRRCTRALLVGLVAAIVASLWCQGWIDVLYPEMSLLKHVVFCAFVNPILTPVFVFLHMMDSSTGVSIVPGFLALVSGATAWVCIVLASADSRTRWLVLVVASTALCVLIATPWMIDAFWGPAST